MSPLVAAACHPARWTECPCNGTECARAHWGFGVKKTTLPKMLDVPSKLCNAQGIQAKQ